MEPGARKQSGLLARADACRDSGDWAGAAELYAAWLARDPQDAAIWIQHGHCVKEAGDPAASLDSYRRAAELRPDDADLAVQLGHACKLTGDLPAARAAYARALELAPANEAAWREVVALAAAGVEAPVSDHGGFSLLGDPRLAFDVSDLLSWFGTHRAPSGIQRIQMEIGTALLAPDAAVAALRLVLFRPDRGTWRELPREAFRRLCALARSGGDPAEAAWRATLGEVGAMLDAAPDLHPLDAEWLVNLGTSWQLPGYHQAVRAARGTTGLRYAALVHDIGPLTMPEHSEPETTVRFARWFASLGLEADLLLAVSAATRDEMLRLAADELRVVSLAPVRLMRPDARPAAASAGAEAEAAAPPTRPYTLFVGTIESRKDHLFVLNAWLAGWRRHGDAWPMLVLAGRAGFGAEHALALLRDAPGLRSHALWIAEASDATVAALRRDALFAIYHSRHEGWGLPVTEALASGKAVVAPALPALMEAGQGLALHYAPGSEPEFLEHVERLAFDPAFRTEQQARIAAAVSLRSWRAVADDLLRSLSEARGASRAAAEVPPLGTVHDLRAGRSSRPSLATAWAEMLRVGAGWHAPEAEGCRTRPGCAGLMLPLPEGVAGPLRLHVALRGAEAPRRVTLRLGRAQRRAVDVEAGARIVVVLEVLEPGPVAEVTIEVAPPPDDPAPEIGIGVVAVMACAPHDSAARLAFLETLALVWPEVA
ncbi:glycosyltransferase [Falsiroseomonas oryziterrae]|uniref:glycosyltransferase n=1 Tax=Falsiroseomonas oryziterrae TaxID=2911368 RepID=UPI001F381827|nr:glycosyltransferase [Roseomonas sp. NPKOSM-4]